ncbi:MAG: hypothetical protein IKT29_05100 [Flavobacteriales bacterium]|nr:hypothetical protein [Flavobacteriales bacterium]
MKPKIFIIVAMFTLIATGLGFGYYMYAKTPKFTPPTDSQSTEREPVFRYMKSPPEVPCTAYVFRTENELGQHTYKVSTSMNIDGVLIESRDGYVLDCIECISRCSAYYQLCDEYGVEYE